MRFDYLLYPEAKEKLQSSGLLKRIEEVKDNEDRLPYIGYTTKEYVAETIKEMREEGYFETFPKESRKAFMAGLNDAFQDENSSYKIERGSKIISETSEPEDFYIMTGWLASVVLNKDELWDYKKYGFDNISDFVSSLGVAVWNRTKTDFRSGYEWISTDSRSRTFKNNITGDNNLDLRIHQTDITPYKTIDPTGVQVSYRPELDEDRRNVIGYHSTEPSLLIGVLKWIRDANIPTEMLKDNGVPLIEYTKSLGHVIGAATECFGFDDCITDIPSFLFINFDSPLARLGDLDTRSIDGIFTENQNYYRMYIGNNNELIFRYESQNKIDFSPDKNVIFQPSDADNILKGISFQSANGLGRTVPKKIIDIIQYRFTL
ncbi:MAG: hypothetical protein WC867_02765 [Candidatus Pacearchaeota archaeon]|jgi:hypothetical protein